MSLHFAHLSRHGFAPLRSGHNGTVPALLTPTVVRQQEPCNIRPARRCERAALTDVATLNFCSSSQFSYIRAAAPSEGTPPCPRNYDRPDPHGSTTSPHSKHRDTDVNAVPHSFTLAETSAVTIRHITSYSSATPNTSKKRQSPAFAKKETRQMPNKLIARTTCHAIVVASLMAVNAVDVQSQTTNTSASSPSIQTIPTPNMDSIFGSFKLDRLGGELISIWNDSQEGTRYYYPPSLLPEWSQFRSNVDETCATLGDDDLRTVNLRIYLNDEYYETEIREKIADFTDKDQLDEHKLSALPHDNIQLFLHGTDALSPRLIYDRQDRSRSIPDDGAQRVSLLAYPREIETPISGACSSLRNLAITAQRGMDVLSGRIYFQGIVYETTSFSAQLSKYLNSQEATELFGDESIVRKASYSNRFGFVNDENGKNLLLRLPFFSYSGSAESSRKRILSREYVDYVSSLSFTGIEGGCVEASANTDKCKELRSKFLTFLIDHSKTVEVTFRKLEDGSFELVSDQVGYATISPQQYQTIASAAPSFEGKVDGEEVKYLDQITWDFSGSEPIPTKVELRLVDEQALRTDVEVYWYERIPVKEGVGRFVSDLNYFPLRIADGNILPLGEYVELEKFKYSCQEGGKIVRLMSGNVWTSSGRKRGVRNDSRAISHRTRSSRCSIGFRGGWNANEGHFFLLREDLDPVTVIWRAAAGGWRFASTTRAHRLDVPRTDGSAQMIDAVSYSGRASRGHKWFGKLPCGATIQFNLQQYPVSCAPYLIEGYTEVHRVAGTSSVE